MIAEPSEFAPHFEGCRCGRCPLYPVEFWKKGDAHPAPLRRVVKDDAVGDAWGYMRRVEYECGHVREHAGFSSGPNEVGMLAPCGQCGKTEATP